jgi:hypothetical protein
MQLNEVIEENSIATISKRTRLSVENIEKLVHRDFSGMKRVKALGFISILEREFGIELSSLKKECAEHFSSYPDEEFDAKLVVTIPESGEHVGGKTSKLLMLLILFAVGYGAWYFFANKGDTQDSNTTSSTSLIGSIVNQAQEWLGNSSALDADNVPVPTEGVWAESDIEKNATQPTSQEAQANAVSSQDQNSDEANDSAAEEQIIREVKEEQKEIIAQERESNNTDANLSDNTLADESLAIEVPSMVNETNADEIVSIEKKSVEQSEVASKPKPRKEKQAASSSIGMGIVTLHPTKKVWVGYTDLSTMKRAAKVIEEDIDFDTSSGSWILVAGHNAIDFVIKGKTITPKKREKNYFLIKNGKVKDISQEEFQKLNKSTVW